MNKLLLYTIIAIIAITTVSATDLSIEDDMILMDPSETTENTICVTQGGQPMDIRTVITKTCKDVDGQVGCQAEDTLTDDLLLSIDMRTGIDGCSEMIITTTSQANGTYYYHVGGVSGGVVITSETGRIDVNVPEFGVVAALGLLIGCGIFIKKKRG